MTLQKIEFMYDIPEGYRFVKYDVPKKNEYYLVNGNAIKSVGYNTADYPIVEKIPEQERPKEKLIVQYKRADGKWYDLGDDYEYRIKPKTKIVRFRNFLHSIGSVMATDEDISDRDYFVKWLGDWQEVEIEEND